MFVLSKCVMDSCYVVYVKSTAEEQEYITKHLTQESNHMTKLTVCFRLQLFDIENPTVWTNSYYVYNSYY